MSTGTPRTLVCAALAAALLTGGCATQKEPLYRWGRYEALIYEMYLQPGKADPGTQVAKLGEDLGRTVAEGKRVPPGVHAHLGYLYVLQGNQPAAIHEFTSERELFPESAVFMDRILARLQGGAR